MKLSFAILAAGEGSRLQNEGVALPKPLVKVDGEAMIDRLIRIFMNNGADEIVIITNDLTDMTQQHINELIATGLPIRLKVKTTPSSMHSFYEIMPLLGEGKFCLTTVDTIFQEDEFRRYIDEFRRFEGDGMMAVTDFIDDEKPLYISTDDELSITGFHDDADESYRFISGGIYCLNSKCFPILSRCIESGMSRMRNFQRQLVADGLKLRAYPFSKILDVDHADDIRKAEQFLNEESHGHKKVLMIYRAREFSPNMENYDADILNAVGKILKEHGAVVKYVHEEDFQSVMCGDDVVAHMCRRDFSLQLLMEMESKGTCIINTPQSIANCSRECFVRLFDEAGIPQPKQYNADNLQFPLWQKNRMGWTCRKDDVRLIHSSEGVVASSDFMYVEHIEGNLIKFYGVRSADFFFWKYADGQQVKFGSPVDNAPDSKFSFSEDMLKSVCRQAADIIGIEAYGGDCIISENGEIRIIDFNDWPSFRMCRDGAAEKIAAVILSRLDASCVDMVFNDNDIPDSTRQERHGKERYIKSTDTEEWLDTVFTRPIGLLWAKFFNLFGIHPNVITILSIIIGASSSFFFYHSSDTRQGLLFNVIGVLLLMWANFYDSADGQLARMTGKKSRLGRILDGAAGDIWFICIYFALMLRIGSRFTYSGWQHYVAWAILFAVILFNGLVCHARQCGLADYYRNIHLFFLKGKEGSELDCYAQQSAIYRQTSWKQEPLWKFFLWFYVRYTHSQESQTPHFQSLMKSLRQTYGDSIPQNVRQDFLRQSLPLMKWTNILTFNTRAIVLYISCLIDYPEYYILFELTVMTGIYFYMRWKHERIEVKLL